MIDRQLLKRSEYRNTKSPRLPLPLDSHQALQSVRLHLVISSLRVRMLQMGMSVVYTVSISLSSLEHHSVNVVFSSHWSVGLWLLLSGRGRRLIRYVPPKIQADK
jgi:hypothetical protein